MTIEYKDSKRIVGLSEDFIGTSGWTTSNSSSIGISGNEITIQERSGDYDEVAYKSFTALGADASFTFRFPIKITTITQTVGDTDSIRVVMGVSSASDIADSTARDEVGIIWRVTDTINKFYAFTADGTGLTSHYSGTDFATTPSTTGGDGNGNYYVEISGSGGTYTFKLFSDSTYDSLIESESITDAGITGLQYYVFRTWELTTHSNQARATVTISDKPNSVQDNSLLVEKDTARRYWFSEATATTEETLDSTNGTASWNVTNGGSDITIDTSNNEIDITGTGQKSGYYDLGASISATAWTLRFKIASSGSPTGNPLFWVGMFDVNTIDSRNTNVDGISLMIYTGSTYKLSMKNGSHMDSGGSQTNTSPTVSADTTTRYVEIVRNGSNAILTFYDSDTYTTSIGTCTVAITGSAFRYLCAISYFEGSGRTYSLSNVKFYNETTSVTPATWTKQPSIIPTVAGLKLHLDASDISTITKDSSNYVSAWNDKSGEGNHLTQSTASKQPLIVTNALDTLPIIRFDGSDDFMNRSTFVNGAISQGFYMFIVMKPSSSGSTASPYNFDSASGTRGFCYSPTSSPSVIYGCDTGVTVDSSLPSTHVMYTFFVNGASSNVRKNSTSINSSNLGSSTINGLWLATRHSETGKGNVEFAEFLIYDNDIGTTNRDAIESYLTDKWGL